MNSLKKLTIPVQMAVVWILVFLLSVSNLFSVFDYAIRDAVYQIPRGIDSRIKIIGIDERSLEELGPVDTWSRSVYADLVSALNADAEYQPSVIGFDILFSGQKDEAGDTAFAEACKNSGNVVTVSQFVYAQKPEKDAQGGIRYTIRDYLEPYTALAAVTQQGYSNVSQDSDGVVRRIQPEQAYADQTYSMFSWEVYRTYCAKNQLEPKSMLVDKYGKSSINYSGRPGDYECISIIDVLNGKIDSRAFANSIVLVGAYATGMQDNFSVPNGYSKQMFGVEIHANILQAAMDGRFAVHADPYLAAAVLGVIAALLHLLFSRKKLWLSTIMLVLAVGAEIGTGMWLNEHGQIISLVYMPVVAVLSYIYCLAGGYFAEKLKRRKVMSAFKKYVAPEVVDELMKQGDLTVRLNGENRDIAVLFVDIRGFTTMSEILEPEQVVQILNQYLNLTTKAIFQNKGTLDKFVGDATMAVFNSPFDLDDYVFRAVCAAMDIVTEGQALEKKLLAEFGRTVGFGVGVNCGPAVVGNVGCEFRMDYTAIGDTVNTAARLEANAKKGQVLISDAVYHRIQDRITVEEVGEIPLKGKSKGVFVYSVTSVKRGANED